MTARHRPTGPTAGATGTRASVARSAPTRPTRPPPIPTRGSTARPTGARAGCASWACAHHVLMENRHGLVLGAMATRATGTAEREAALALIDKHRGTKRGMSLGADRAYDVAAFIGELRRRRVTPHIAVNGAVSKLGRVRRTALDGRTLRHASYDASQRRCKTIEEVFGWAKVTAGLARVKVRGLAGSMPPSPWWRQPTTCDGWPTSRRPPRDERRIGRLQPTSAASR